MQAQIFFLSKVYTKNDLRLYLQESNKTIREIFYFDMIDYKINAFEESLFCGGVLLQSIDLSGNEIDMIDMSMFKCVRRIIFKRQSN
jgi:hypothetical protein